MLPKEKFFKNQVENMNLIGREDFLHILSKRLERDQIMKGRDREELVREGKEELRARSRRRVNRSVWYKKSTVKYLDSIIYFIETH